MQFNQKDFVKLGNYIGVREYKQIYFADELGNQMKVCDKHEKVFMSQVMQLNSLMISTIL